MNRRISHAEWDQLKAHSARNLNNPLWLGGGHCLNQPPLPNRLDADGGWWVPQRSARYVAPGDVSGAHGAAV